MQSCSLERAGREREEKEQFPVFDQIAFNLGDIKISSLYFWPTNRRLHLAADRR